ncbi:aminotransferase class I/II-fold pyridoxal phosphate-dependent enzyme [Marinitenerispora sediminis]|uniref:Uncharacterized protein n=1 Tax=Marinitenerispora sediminis TaxID=1931232 RepID=A0A368T5W4_9ACTN|nr:aminotransferase class I/II-fold pyridoxal phosphate-dependent enzyme [Marinitenerispora sediminis]RCV51853.1 hypothetical protein DEF28_14375 [Marinitenerispora sediminis]RCV54824.1 hypothetical protein DEF23_15330 [Marinitenerispora sediminis]RCV58970.1 hypothetical protein DEF24_11650 [Marinitenerispora sediminis]
MPTHSPSGRLWPWWSSAARAEAAARISRGDLSAADARDPDISALEDAVRRELAPDAHVLACASGTAALASAYAALGCLPGAEILVPSHTFRATVTPLVALGLVPVLCDTHPATGSIDLEDAAARVTRRTEGIVVTHMWGRPVPLAQARAFADQHHLALVEDCSHAHGTRHHDQPVGGAADVAVWSLGTTKMVSGGTCGALTTRDRALFDRAVVFGQPKHRALAEATEYALRAVAQSGLGQNLRANPLAAILARDHLDRLGAILAVKNERQAAVEKLLTGLPETGLVPLPRPPGHTHGALYKWHWLHPDAARATTVLAEAGLRARRPAPGLHTLPMFTQPALARLLLPGAPRLPQAGDLPATDRFLAGLIELDTRDVYDPATDPVALYEAALTRAASRLHI